MKIYIAGPMTGYPEYNFPAFDEAAAHLRSLGHEVFSPADNDRENGFDATGLEGHEAEQQGFNLRRALKQDLSWICDHADALAVLHGWHRSKGALTETALATALGLDFAFWHRFDENGIKP